MKRVSISNDGSYFLVMTLIYVVCPFVSFVIALCMFRNRVSQFFYIAFAFYFGWQLGPNFDLLTHYQNYLTFINRPLSWIHTDFKTLYLGQEPFHILFKYLLSLFNVSARVFSGWACAVYATAFVFYMREFSPYFKNLNLIRIIVLVGAAVVVEFQWYFGLRFWTGAFVFMIFYLHYTITGKKLYLFLTPICLLFHVVLIVFVGCAFVSEVIRNMKLNYFLLVVGFFYRTIDFGFTQLVASLPFVKMFYKSNYQGDYLQASLARRSKDYIENGNLVYRSKLPLMLIGVFLTLLFLWMKNKNVNKVFPKMYGLFIILIAVANFGYSDFVFYGRVLKMATLVGYAYLFIVLSQPENMFTIKSLFYKIILAVICLFGLMTAIVEERVFLNNILLWYGNYLTPIPLLNLSD